MVKKYDSPNAGISEAIFAYISDIKLGGKNKYKNEIIKKSYLNGKKYDSPNAGISEAIFAYISGVKLGGKSKYKKEIIEKPIINATGDSCTGEKIKLICQLIPVSYTHLTLPTT